jgi:tRNA A37 N6-isopentenylltransferase MiaA
VSKQAFQTWSPSSIRKLGLKALAESLGPVGMARFLQQFETGSGDYTKERKKWLRDMDVKTIVEEIRGRCKTK